VIDCGPGVPEADRERMFTPFQRLGNTDSATGVGLGLAVSRGLTEAMRGTLQPAQTPGGGLTMTMSLPAAPRLTQADLPGCRPQGLDREARYRFVTRPDPPWNFRIGHLGQGRQSARCADSTLDPMNSSRSTSKAGAPAARRLARSPSAGTICAVPPSYIWVRYLTVGRWWPR
jgi:hypothetical protein